MNSSFRTNKILFSIGQNFRPAKGFKREPKKSYTTNTLIDDAFEYTV